jgi:hypothetical protein
MKMKITLYAHCSTAGYQAIKDDELCEKSATVKGYRKKRETF